MKRTITLAALICLAYAMSACVETTTTDPSGRVVVIKQMDPAAKEAALKAAEIAWAEYQRQHPPKAATVTADK